MAADGDAPTLLFLFYALRIVVAVAVGSARLGLHKLELDPAALARQRLMRLLLLLLLLLPHCERASEHAVWIRASAHALFTRTQLGNHNSALIRAIYRTESTETLMN